MPSFLCFDNLVLSPNLPQLPLSPKASIIPVLSLTLPPSPQDLPS